MSWRHEKKSYLDFPFSLTFFPRYLLIFLKFVQAVIPTIEYDYTRHFTMWSWTKSTELNPLNPKRDQHLFSPNNNTAESFIKIMRKKGNDHQPKKFWLLNKFSSSVPNEMHREELGEYKYWC